MTTNDTITGAELQDGDIIEYPQARNGRADVYGLTVAGDEVSYTLVFGVQPEGYCDGDGDDVIVRTRHTVRADDRFRLWEGVIGGVVFPQARQPQQLHMGVGR